MSEEKKLRAAVLVSGGGTNLQALIDAVRDGCVRNTELICVISNNPGAYALKRAETAGIPCETISPKDYPDRDAFDDALTERLISLKPGLIVLAGCLLKIPPALIAAFPNRIINIHPALIPAFSGKGYYGLRVHEAALKRGVRVSGATVHFVNDELDGGPIILQKAVTVLEDDTPEVLQRRIMEEAEWKILPQAVDMIAAGRIYVDENGRVRTDGAREVI